MKKQLDKTIQKAIVSETQIAIDYAMVPYDLWGTMVHVIMLCQTGIISKKNASLVLHALMMINEEYKRGKFTIDKKKGAQLTLEAKILQKAGEQAGLFVHTARSRNDQVMVAEMLYLRDKILELALNGTRVINRLLVLAGEHRKTVMPGYTHMRPAKPTTFAHWCMAYADSLLRVFQKIQYIYTQYDRCPLGAVESYGTTWPIDRTLTANLLGFKNVWEIPQDAISSRGEFQLVFLSALNYFTIAASRMAIDLLLFTTNEFNILSLGDSVSQRLHPITGSSVMPQKRNPDVLELIRSTALQVAGYHQIVSGILAGLPTGYNRDSREVKEYLKLGFDKTTQCIVSLEKVLTTLSVNRYRMIELLRSGYFMTTDLADYLSQQTGLPYRLIYKIVGQVVDQAIRNGKLLSEITTKDLNVIAENNGFCFYLSETTLMKVFNPTLAVEKRTHVGGANPKQTDSLIIARQRQVKSLKRWFSSRQKRIMYAKKKTLSVARRIIGVKVNALQS